MAGGSGKFGGGGGLRVVILASIRGVFGRRP